MTKMASAKMDVVRFSESDVVVASRNRVMMVSGIGDDTTDNVLLTYKTKEYNVAVPAELQSFATAFTAGSGYTITSDAPIYVFGDHDTTLPHLATYDTNTGLVSLNGNYIWTGEHFTKQ